MQSEGGGWGETLRREAEEVEVEKSFHRLQLNYASVLLRSMPTDIFTLPLSLSLFSPLPLSALWWQHHIRQRNHLLPRLPGGIP